ncbi:MAG TPA: lipase family protein [Caulobacteraceae bacterium]
MTTLSPLARASSAVPDAPAITPADVALAPTWRAAWSVRTALLMAAMADYAYRSPAELELRLTAGGLHLVGEWDIGGVRAFLAFAPGQLAVLAFRGTAEAADWAINLDAELIPMPGRPRIRVHRGFWDAYARLGPEIARAVDFYAPAGLGFYVTGHSLGGALAQIATAALERDNLAACYTFGSPRVATVDFDEQVKAPHYRVVDNWDLVPGVPPATPSLFGVGGYRHTGDPRLLRGPAPTEALRRDRDLVPRFVVDLASLLAWPFTHRLSSVGDHMIWRYHAKLAGIVAGRAKG